MTEERWLPVTIAGFEDLYEVSDLGRVRSLDRMVWSRGHKSMYLKRGHLLTPTPDTHGYLGACLTDRARKQIKPLVHHLVLNAFVGPCPPGQERRHGPGGRQDNRLVNLCYGTASQNAFDKYRDGTMLYGSRSPRAKLTEATVRECRARHATGDRRVALMAEEFGVSRRTMWSAIAGRTWKHVAA